MRSLAPVVALTVFFAPALASAQQGCPPGRYCEEQEAPSAEPPVADEQAEPSPPSPEPRFAAPPHAPPPPPAAPRGRTIVVPPGARVIIVRQPELAPPPPVQRRWRPHWGLNLRLEGVSLGASAYDANGDEIDRPDDRAGMWGLGASLRYRFVPSFALDFGLDLLKGRDYHGFERTENALSASMLWFVNPRSAVQFYLLGGFSSSAARVSVPWPQEEGYGADLERYSYFGAQLGMGLEFRITRRYSLNTDVVGFVRGRTDAAASARPEYVSPVTGQTTNTSSAALFRGGMTFYW